MQGTGAHKSGPNDHRMLIVLGLLLFFEHKTCPQDGFWYPNKARPGQSDIRIGSVFHKEYLGFHDLVKKSAKIWLEVAIDHMRVKRCGLKWPSTS